MDEQEVALKNEIDRFRKLARIKEYPEFKDYFEAQLDVVCKKLIWTFTTGKDGDNVKTWDDFCKVRGEIVARLQPIQDIYSAEEMVELLKNQLKQYYNVDNNV